MPRASPVTASVLPVGVGCGLGPVTCAELADWGGEWTPHPVREGWLRGIEQRGRQSGRFQGSLTLAAASVGLFGFQLSSEALGGADLNPDAAELLLFGNVGRTGEPRDFHLNGSSLDAWAVTTAALAVGIPLDVEIGDAPAQSFAVGATLKYTFGNALFLARDLGSFFSGDPLEVWTRFPVLQARGTPTLRAGDGVGVDIGFQWEAGPWSFGLGFENVVNTFSWNVDALVFRSGTALFNQDESESDFVSRPATEASQALLDEVRAFRFGPRLSFGFARIVDPRTSLFTQLDLRLGRSSDRLPDAEAGAGFEYRPLQRLPLRAHVSLLDGGVRLGGGVGLRVGPVHLGGAVSSRSDAGLQGPDWIFTVSFGGG
jgi:hypothetical protein